MRDSSIPISKEKLDPKAEVLSIVQKSGTSFYWAMRLLPSQKRDAMFAIYAFCREVDDIADGEESSKIKLKKLQYWREQIYDLYKGRPKNLIMQALVGPLKNYDLAKEDFVAVIDGMETDAIGQVRIKNMDALVQYCDRVACAVGRLSNAVFGLAPEQRNSLAKALGEALQLTNILRDIHEDAKRNHIYLPKDLLAQNGIDNREIKDILESPRLPEVCSELAERTRQNFKQAKSIIKNCDKTRIRPAIIMMEIYHRLFVLLERRGWDSLNLPVKVSKVWKLFLVARILIFNK